MCFVAGETEEVVSTNSDTFKPIYFRKIRKDRGLSLENMTDIMNISKSELSRFERGEKEFDDNLFNTGIHFLNPDFHFLSDEVNPEEKLLELVRAEYYGNEEKRKELVEWFKSREALMQNSQWFYHYRLFQLYLVVYSTAEKKKSGKIDQLLSDLSDGKDLFEEDVKALLFLYRARLLGMDHQASQAEKEILKAKKFSNGLTLPEITELLLALQIQLLILEGRLGEVFPLIYQLKDSYYRQRNFWRLTPLSSIEACCLMRANDYRSAKKVLKTEYQKLTGSAEIRTRRAFLDNLIWVHLYLEEFEEALKFMDELLLMGPAGSTNCINRPYCLYRLQESEAAIESVKTLRNDPSLTKYDLKILQAYESLIRGKTKTYLNQSRKLIEQTIQEHSCEETKFFLQCELQYLDSIGEIEYGNERRKLLVEVLKSNS